MVEHLLPQSREKSSLHSDPGSIARKTCERYGDGADGEKNQEGTHFAAIPAADHTVNQIAKQKWNKPVEGHFQNQSCCDYPNGETKRPEPPKRIFQRSPPASVSV